MTMARFRRKGAKTFRQITYKARSHVEKHCKQELRRRPYKSSEILLCSKKGSDKTQGNETKRLHKN